MKHILKKKAGVKPTSPLATSETDAVHVWKGGNKTVICRGDETLEHSMHTNGEAPSRQRMRPWLEARINSGEIKGLEWMDTEQMIFRVPWKHVGNREWTESDGQIFKEWAVHTGKHREGVDEADYPTWKTRLRCAFTKLPDITELRHLNCIDGHVLEPYRVYQFVHKCRRESPTTENLLPDANNGAGPINGMYIKAEFTIPTTVHHDLTSASGEGNMDPERLDSDLMNIPSGDLLPRECEIVGMNDQDYDMDMVDGLVPGGDDDMQLQIEHKASKSYFDMEAQQLATHLPPVSDHEPGLYIHVRYREESKLEQLCENPSVCRIFHGPSFDFSPIGKDFNEVMCGPADASQILLPPCQSSNVRANELTAKLLNVMDRGVVFSMQNGSITAKRLCRCTIFVSSPSLNGDATTKLLRDETIVIYDYRYFQRALDLYIHQQGPKPVTEIVVGFGQRFDSESPSSLLMSATVTHVGAHDQLSKVVCTSPLSPPIEISTSNDYDKYLDQMKQLVIQDNSVMV